MVGDPIVGTVPDTVMAVDFSVVLSQYAIVNAFVSCLHASHLSDMPFIDASICTFVPQVIVSHDMVQTLQYDTQGAVHSPNIATIFAVSIWIIQT